jgi:hypothetical protein
MNIERAERWEKVSATIGAAIWAGLAWMAGTGRAPLGVIELLLLFAPLVVVPLGLALSRTVAPLRHVGMESFVRVLQLFAAGLLVASFWVTPGWLAGTLVAPWLILCASVGLAGGLTLLYGRNQSLAAWAVNIGRIDLAVASGWLLISRWGIRPMGFQEPIVLLTAIHFHYTGFATALLAGTLIAFAQQRGVRTRLLEWVITLVIAMPFVVAVGFVWSSTLKLVAVLVLAGSLVILAGMQFWSVKDLSSGMACLFLRLSAVVVIAGMVLAGIYALGDWLKQDWLMIPRMASTHGLLNGLGFVLLGLLGWLVHLSVNMAS